MLEAELLSIRIFLVKVTLKIDEKKYLLKLIIDFELLNVRIFLVKVNLKIGQEKYLLLILF